MRVGFLATTSAQPDATSWHQALPRKVRKTLRLHTPKTPCNEAHTDLTAAMHRHEARDSYLTINTVDEDFDLTGSQTHGDCDCLDNPDNEYQHLTIVRPGRDARRWLKGYNIL